MLWKSEVFKLSSFSTLESTCYDARDRLNFKQRVWFHDRPKYSYISNAFCNFAYAIRLKYLWVPLGATELPSARQNERAL